MGEVHWDRSLNKAENYLKVERDDPEGAVRAPGGKLQRDQQTLVHLIFWLTHTRDGRDFLRGCPLDNNTGDLSSATKDRLMAAFVERGVTDERILSALVQSHVAALKWHVAFDANDVPGQESQEKAYLQHTAFLTWCLWENAKDHEFSMIW